MKVVRTVILSLILVFLAFVIYRAAKGGRKIPASTIRAEYRDIESKLTIPGVKLFMLFDGKKIEFVLLEKLKGVDTKGWIFFAAAAVLAAALIIFLVQRRKKCTEPAAFTGNPTPTVILVHGALCIAISFVLSYFKLFSMPNGGSITLASMLPLMVYSNRYGAKYGVMAGVVYGFLQYIQNPEMTHWIQMLVDYPIAFGVIGLGGLVKGERNLVFSVLIGGTLRFLCHLFTGAVFFGEYAAAGQSAFMYSLLYNAPYMFADIAVCVIIAMLPPFRKAIRSALKY